MGLIRKLLWLSLFLGLTFSFVVVFEHGTADFPAKFPEHAKAEFESLQKYLAPMKTKENDGAVILIK